jgi:predicted nuclease of predicted toxin-antitoxin system
MRFLVDNQLPGKLAAHLRGNGHDCAHVLELGLDTADDATVWAHATAHQQVVISKDEDFVYLALRPGDAGRLIWVRLGNCRNAVLLAAFDAHLDYAIAALSTGQRIVEIR